MSLSHDQIPLPCSLKTKVEEAFSPKDAPLSADALSPEALIRFLAKSKDTDNSPLATIKRRAAKEKLRDDLRPGDHAILVWVCEAFDEWEDHYALEQPLKDHIRRLLPLAVAMALKEESFYTPGTHDLHRLLDALQNGAVGWQMRLDRAGQMLEQRIQRAVEKALDWFNNDRLDIAAITQELVAANERDAARAQRMVQRLAETEEARLKTLTSRREAALDINKGLESYDLPAAIGEFLKGPWYDSAQLVLVKHSSRSREWDQMRRATVHLMESVQNLEDGGDAGRDRQEQILRHLPGELRRWLLSLEHDSDATDSAIGLVEYAHLRIQHGQKLQLVKIPPIPVEKEPPAHEGENEDSFITGDWYKFEDDEGELRAQLVLQLERGQHLLFANFVGLKALDISRQAFSQRVNDGFSEQLPNRHTFSISLASAAGIDSDDRLRQFIDPGYRPPEEQTPEEPSEPESSDTDEQSDSEQQTQDDGGRNEEPQEEAVADSNNAVDSSEAETWSEELPDLSDGDEWDPVLEPPEGAELELSLEMDEPEAPPADTSIQAPTSPPQASEIAPPEQPRSDTVAQAPAPEQPRADTMPQAPAPAPASPPAPPSPAMPATPQAPSYAAPQTPTPTPAPPPIAAPPSPPPPPPPPPPVTTPPVQEPAPPPQPATPPPLAPVAPAPGQSPPASTEREVDVPMGAWLGFHDGETPIMAKLAVFDPRRDNYIFVNRKGIALRELSRAELRTLMDRGLVDILETRSYFRDEVERAREEGQ